VEKSLKLWKIDEFEDSSGEHRGETVANSEDQDSDQVWHTAVEWVIREHESFSPAEREELIGWLNMNPAHKKAYDEASRLWLITGLIPPFEPPAED